MKRLISLITLFVACQLLSAQQKGLVIFGVIDNITCEGLENVKIDLILNDTVDVPYKTISQGSGDYRLEFDYKAGKYTILVEKEGYTPAVHHFTSVAYRNSIIGAGSIRMIKERVVGLNEVVVKATRIKMVMRGDTIVYDADAFNLAEGSMLDALVAQLPNAELKDGQIKVNGKVIENLMLNGEDFFSGNPKVALQNLPSYTVKNIKVYDKAANSDYLKSESLRNLNKEEHMVMDVVLKKKYQHGFLGNIEGGYGVPNDMYLGKLFGLGYWGRSRLAAFANMNNIKDTQTGSAGGNWNGGWAQEGEMDLKMGGLDFLYSKSKFKYSANATVSHEEPVVVRKGSTVNFYNDGDVYGRSLNDSRDKKLHLISKHRLEYSGNRAYTEIRPSMDYMVNDYSSLTRSAEFSSSPDERYRLQSLDSIYSNKWTTSRYAAALMNRVSREQVGKRDWMILGLDAYSKIQFPKWGDNLDLTFKGNYRKDNNDSKTSYNRVLGQNVANNGENILQENNNSSTVYNLNGQISYTWVYTPYQTGTNHGVFAVPYLEVGRDYSKQDNLLYQFAEQYNDTGDSEIVPPSAIQRDMLFLDINNTAKSEHGQNKYHPGIDFVYAFVPSMSSGKQYDVTLSLSDNMQQEQLHYYKTESDTTINRFAHNIKPGIRFGYKKNTSEVNEKLKLSYTFTEGLPNIFYQLDRTNTSSPTNIYLNNPNLNKSRTHSVGFEYSRFLKSKYRNLSVTASYKHTDRAVANAKYYDRTTGVTTWKPENIDGNWNAVANVNYSTPLRNSKFQFGTNTGVSFVHSVDYVTDDLAPAKSIVDNLSISENLSLTYKLDKGTVGIRSGVSWLRGTSERATFEDISAFNINAVADATINLPRNWQVTSDLGMYCRTGYTDDVLNTTNWIWNAAVAKTLLKGKLTLKLTATDILNQIDNVSHSINAQGQTETWVNSLSNYVMLHAIWRFNVMPKKE